MKKSFISMITIALMILSCCSPINAFANDIS